MSVIMDDPPITITKSVCLNGFLSKQFRLPLCYYFPLCHSSASPV